MPHLPRRTSALRLVRCRSCSTSQSLPWSSSLFGLPKLAAVAAADFTAELSARPQPRRGSLWTASKRPLNRRLLFGTLLIPVCCLPDVSSQFPC
jgi:hypothetical protein